MVQVEHFLVYQQDFLDGGNKLIDAFSCSDIGGSSISVLIFLSKYRAMHAEWYKAFSAKSSDVTLKIISLSDICSATRLILWVLFSYETLCIFLSCLKALCMQNMQYVQSISEALDRVTIVKLSSLDDGFWLHDAEVGRVDLKLEHVDRFCLLANALQQLLWYLVFPNGAFSTVVYSSTSFL